MDETEMFYPLTLADNVFPWYALLVQLAYLDVHGGYYLYFTFMDDEGNWDKSLGGYPLTDAEHYVEIYLIRESSDGAGDGIGQVWIDGALKGTISTVDNWSAFADIAYVMFGSFEFGGTPTGALYLDEIKANDDGSEIGALGGSSSAPEFTPTGLLLAVMGSLGVYLFLQRNWRLARLDSTVFNQM